MARRACLAIGVSTVTPPKNKAMRFGFLSGAVPAAKAIGEWARRAGFGDDNVRIVTDERVKRKDNPVTRERVQAAVDELFPAGADKVGHFVLAFCGHGLTDQNIGQIPWLFSDSDRQKYRVLSSAFYEELLLNGVERITLITDACREAPKELDLMRLDPVRGIVVEGEKVDSPKMDIMAACQDGQLGYMVSEANSAAAGKCIFSGVVADALWGLEPSAIANGEITTSSLGICVGTRTTSRAKEYRLKLNPQIIVYPEPALLYSTATPLGGAPEVQPWPPAGAATTMGAAAGISSGAIGGASKSAGKAGVSMFKKTMPPLDPMDMHLLRSGSVAAAIGGPTKPRRSATPRSTSRPAKPSKSLAKIVADLLERKTASESRNEAASEISRSLAQIKPSMGPESSNLVVASSQAAVWATGEVRPGRRTRARIGFQLREAGAGSPVLIEFEDGAFTPHVPYRDLYALVKRDRAGNVYQAYGEHFSRDSFRLALRSIADFGAGRLAAGDIGRLAAQLRHGKFADPVLGAICAYLYRTVADQDSIRRMAYFYCSNGQAVPYDIALLGEMKVTRDTDGALRLHVPAVRARKPGPGDEGLPAYVTTATWEAEGKVGGLCPWLALGWDYVNLARPDWELLVDGLADHARDVPRSGFTLLPPTTGGALARLWGLERRM